MKKKSDVEPRYIIVALHVQRNMKRILKVRSRDRACSGTTAKTVDERNADEIRKTLDYTVDEVVHVNISAEILIIVFCLITAGR